MGKHLITASLFNKRGMLLTQATNSYTKTHPAQIKYAEQSTAKIYLHAEIAALVKLRKGMEPYKIVIERYGKDGRSRIAKPCPVCERAIKAWNIKRVEYTV